MKRFFALILVLAFPAGVFAAEDGGHKEGNGGDAVYCAPSKDNDFSGLYSLDYIVAKIYNPGGIREYATNGEAMAPVMKRLAWFAPDLAQRLEDFRTAFENQVILGRPGRTNYYYWRKADASLIDVEDEGLYSDLPPNCRDSATARPALRQAVTRVERKGQVLFNYHGQTLTELASHGDQLSWLIFHEFLWSYFSDSASLKEANEYLHSSEFQRNSPEEVADYLKSLGFFEKQRTFTRNDLLELRKAMKDGEPSFTFVSTEVRPHYKWIADLLADEPGPSPFLPGGFMDEPRTRLEWLVFVLDGIRQGTNFTTKDSGHIPYQFVFSDVSQAEVQAAEDFGNVWIPRVRESIEVYERILPVVVKAANYLKYNNRVTVTQEPGVATCEEVGEAASKMAEILFAYPHGLDDRRYSRQYLEWWNYQLVAFQAARGCRPAPVPPRPVPQKRESAPQRVEGLRFIPTP